MLFGKKKQTSVRSLKEAEKRIREAEARIDQLAKNLEAFLQAMEQAVQNVGVVRYNAFAEAGGDQSFSAAFLDGKQNGMVLTSHYGRDVNRVYAKPVREGRSEYALSAEEEEAIRKALAKEQPYGATKHSNSRKAGNSRA